MWGARICVFLKIFDFEKQDDFAEYFVKLGVYEENWYDIGNIAVDSCLMVEDRWYFLEVWR